MNSITSQDFSLPHSDAGQSFSSSKLFLGIKADPVDQY